MLLGNSPLRDFSSSKSLFNLVWLSQRLSDLLFGYYEAVPSQKLELFFSVASIDYFLGHIYPPRFSTSAV